MNATVNTPVSLEELLASRDARQAMQRRLLAESAGGPLIVVTVIIPGNVKRCRESLVIAHAACEALEKAFGSDIVPVVKQDLHTGFEAYYRTGLDASAAKRITSSIEDKHPLGRLMDIDVIDTDGTLVSRAGRGEAPRKCLICDLPARVCMRAFTHTRDELWQELRRRVLDYESQLQQRKS